MHQARFSHKLLSFNPPVAMSMVHLPKNGTEPPVENASLVSSDADSMSLSVPEGGDALSPVVAQVRDRIGRPVDRWAVVATLETLGLRDTDAQQKYGLPDLFALGDRIYPTLQSGAGTDRPSSTRTPRLWRWTARTVWSYARGVLFVAPMALQIASVLLLGYSLWAWLYFTETQATVVALGVLLSFIVTGGFVQSIGREGHLYLSQENPRLAYTACRRLIGLGMLTVGIVAFGLALLNVIFPHYPLHLLSISAVYFVLLSALWLSLSLLYVIDHLSTIAGITLLGIAPVFAVMAYTDWGIYAAHGLGLTFAILLAYGYGTYWLRRRIRRSPETTTSDSLPPLSIQIHSLRAYFGYGLCFFTFLSVDRIIAWSVSGTEPLPYVIWFRTPYELGLDWALLSLLLPLVVLQHTIQKLSGWLFPKTESTDLPVEEAPHLVKQFHVRQLAVILVAGIVSILGTYFGIAALEQSALLQDEIVLTGSPITATVFWGGAFGYLFLAVGLHNLLFPLILSKPGVSLRAFAYALGANVLVGMLLSRGVSYEYAVFGFLIGSLVLAVVSLVRTRRFLDAFPYHYYAAY